MVPQRLSVPNFVPHPDLQRWQQAHPIPIQQPSVLPLRVSRRHEAAIRARRWPDYQRCVENARPNHSKTGPDISRADFVWCMTALDMGWNKPGEKAPDSGELIEVGPRGGKVEDGRRTVYRAR